MGKSINIVSVTKVTIDNVVSEFTKKVKEYYPKTDKFVNVHFESPLMLVMSLGQTLIKLQKKNGCGGLQETKLLVTQHS